MSYLSDSLLNDAANAATRGVVEIKLHSGAPGEAGQQAVVGPAVQVQPDQFTAAGDVPARVGRSQTRAETHFGILSATADAAIEFYSWHAGGVCKGHARFENAPIAVGRGQSFSAAAGAIGIQFSR